MAACGAPVGPQAGDGSHWAAQQEGPNDWERFQHLTVQKKPIGIPVVTPKPWDGVITCYYCSTMLLYLIEKKKWTPSRHGRWASRSPLRANRRPFLDSSVPGIGGIGVWHHQSTDRCQAWCHVCWESRWLGMWLCMYIYIYMYILIHIIYIYIYLFILYIIYIYYIDILYIYRFDWGFTCHEEMIFCARSKVGTPEIHWLRVFISVKARNAEIPWDTSFLHQPFLGWVDHHIGSFYVKNWFNLWCWRCWCSQKGSVTGQAGISCRWMCLMFQDLLRRPWIAMDSCWEL